MRLQLITTLYLIAGYCQAQELDSSGVKIQEDIEVNFLMSYYDQDGNHSAVTGGVGTESLQDYAGALVVNVPLDSTKSLMIRGGITYYTSASNDRIDFRVSSASKKEYRGDLDISLTKLNKSRDLTSKLSFGSSIDVDYFSTSVGYGLTKLWPTKGRQIAVEGKFYYDSWVWLVFPQELRGTERAVVPSRKRLTYNLAVSYFWTINKRLQAAVIIDPTYQHGLLSTPFHRVFYADTAGTFLETLPLDRFKLPLAFRLHYFAGDLLAIRFYYRYYWDTFGIQAHTFNLELPIKFSPMFTAFPYYRFHNQGAADHFQPFKQHQIGARYATSDFDLSELHSHRFGLGIRVSPLSNLLEVKWSKRKYLDFKAFELRFSSYSREDGLDAITISANTSFVIH